MNLRQIQYQTCQRRADLVVEFLELHGRLPMNAESYKGEQIGNFVAAARSLRSRQAMNALQERNVDYTENMRWPKYGKRRIKVTAKPFC